MSFSKLFKTCFSKDSNVKIHPSLTEEYSNQPLADCTSKMPGTPLDVIIIGAGLTGLSLARLLIDNGQSVLVLEARDRIGGRIHTHETTDGADEEGGEYI